MSTSITLNVDQVVYRDDLYPRLETSAQTVQKYAEDLSVLPPIEVNQDNELIDGWHRWTAHRKRDAKTIEAVVTETQGDGELLEIAIERNAKFGMQLSNRDKKNMARQIYHKTSQEERGRKKARLAEILSVSERTVSGWLSRIDKDEVEERNVAIQDLYLRGYTEEQIAEQVGSPRTTVQQVLTRIADLQIPSIPDQFADLRAAEDATEKQKLEADEARQVAIVDNNKANVNHEVDFQVPIYNVWKQQEKSTELEHFGNSEPTWLDRLLYLYTSPFDIVVDPFGGSGTTVDVCKKRFRRAWVSDRVISEENRRRIRELDITEELPDLRKRWSDVKLVYLDPPYWKQAAGQYSDDPTDLANMTLEQFSDTLASVVTAFAKKLKNGEPKYIALIIQPTQWNAPDKQFTDHIGDMLRRVNLSVDMRFSVPYESQQYNPQMVNWAKENKKCLVLTREIVVWRV